MKSVVTEELLEWSWVLATQSGGGASGCDKACDVAPSVNWSSPQWSLCGRTVALERHTTQFAKFSGSNECRIHAEIFSDMFHMYNLRELM